jgi:hypothetical protein
VEEVSAVKIQSAFRGYLVSVLSFLSCSWVFSSTNTPSIWGPLRLFLSFDLIFWSFITEIFFFELSCLMRKINRGRKRIWMVNIIIVTWELGISGDACRKI